MPEGITGAGGIDDGAGAGGGGGGGGGAEPEGIGIDFKRLSLQIHYITANLIGIAWLWLKGAEGVETSWPMMVEVDVGGWRHDVPGLSPF